MAVIRVRHVTTYRYARPVGFGEHRMMLAPRPDDADQRTRSFDLLIEPPPVRLERERDRWGNEIHLARFDQRASRLSFASTAIVETTPDDRSPVAGRRDEDGFRASAGRDAAPFLLPVPDDGEDRRSVERFVDDHRVAGRADDEADGAILSAITKAAAARFDYRPRHAPGVQSPAETLQRGDGTCRDFAVLLVASARLLGRPARFVSGYVVDRGTGGARRSGGSTHAWAQVLLPPHGWVDFDPTNGLVGSRDLVRVSVTPGAAEAVPLGGTFFGWPDDCLGMDVSVRAEIDPDRTLPRTEELAPC